MRDECYPRSSKQPVNGGLVSSPQNYSKSPVAVSIRDLSTSIYVVTTVCTGMSCKIACIVILIPTLVTSVAIQNDIILSAVAYH